MRRKNEPELPTGPLPDLLKWWRKCKVKGVVIGGLAVAFQGFARTTLDVDAIILLDEPRWQAFLDGGEQFSFHSRIPDPLAFAHEARIFLLNHETSGVDIDLSIGQLEYEKTAIRRADKVKVGKLTVPMATVEDLVVLKALANRPRDLIDIEGLLDATGDFDIAYVRERLEEFAAIMDLPDLAAPLEKLIADRVKGRT